MQFYDRNGEQITAEDFNRLLLDPRYRKIKTTSLADTLDVNTVWLGIDYGPGMGWDPLIFETMIFDRWAGPDPGDVWRYSTLQQAEAGHDMIVELARARLVERQKVTGV